MSLRQPTWSYLLAVLVVVTAFSLIQALKPLRQDPYALLVGAIMVAGWVAGLGPALVATVLATILIVTQLLGPFLSWAELAEMATFIAVSMFVTVLNERRRSEVAARRATETVLARERAQLDTVLQQMPGGLLIVEVPSGRIVVQNVRAASIIGVPVMPAMKLDKYPQLLAQRFQRFPDINEWPIMRALRNGEVSDANLECLRSGGERVVLHTAAAPVRDADNRTIAAVGVFEDVTEQTQAEQGLRLLADVGSALANSLDYETTMSTAAAQAVPLLGDWCVLYGTHADNVPAHVATAHVNATKRDVLDRLGQRWLAEDGGHPAHRRVMQSGKVEFVMEVPAAWGRDWSRSAAETPPPLELRSLICMPLRTAGAVLGTITFATGESGRRYGAPDLRLADHFARRVAHAIDNARLYGEMADSDRAKTEFLTIMAHELRNPLAPMRNAVEIMQLRPNDPPTLQRMQGVIQDQLGNLTHLVDDLLDLSRVTRGTIELRPEPVDLGSVIRRVVETHLALIDTRHHDVHVVIADEPLTIHADPTRLDQILANLLSNAVDYTNPGGRITLEAKRGGDMVEIAVIDTGRGIEAALLPHVFDSFRRGPSDAGMASGLGVGLSLVKHLVQLHGGSVVARSGGLGMGSEFVVRLPIAATTSPAVTATMKVDEPPVTKLRVLVVDDNDSAADTMATLLELWGFDVRVAYDGASGLALAKSERPHVALLDLSLPDIDGYELARRLRREPGLERLQIIAITGHGNDEDRRRTRDAGFDQHLVKPVDLKLLQRILHEQSRAQRTD